jgi:ParE toxin of type II toxin-antitoxin system, parDE
MKSKPLEYHPGARLDVLEAVEWYELHEGGLGARFQSALREAEKFVSTNPAMGHPHRYGVGRWPLKTFPFALIYSDEPEMILVVAVAHYSRRPAYWQRRIEK